MAKTNGVMNVDTKQMEEMRTQVVEQELSARSWKAYYEKMYYSMEAEKLEPLYKEYKTRLNEHIAKEKAEYEEFMKKMQQELGEINDKGDGTLNIEEVDITPKTDFVTTPIISMDNMKTQTSN